MIYFNKKSQKYRRNVQEFRNNCFKNNGKNFIRQQAIHEEVTNLGSEDLLIWQNPEENQDSLISGFSWLSNSIAPNLTSAINSINSTLETMLTVEDDEVDTQF